MEHGVIVIGRAGAHRIHQGLTRFADMGKVSRLTGEALPVFGVLLVCAPPEVRCIGHVGVGGIDRRQGVFSWSKDIGRPARASGVLQSVTWTALGNVHADRHGIGSHT